MDGVEPTDIVKAEDMIRMGMCKKNSLTPPDVVAQHLVAEIRRSVDHKRNAFGGDIEAGT